MCRPGQKLKRFAVSMDLQTKPGASSRREPHGEWKRRTMSDVPVAYHLIPPIVAEPIRNSSSEEQTRHGKSDLETNGDRRERPHGNH